MSQHRRLMSPLTIGGMELRNRIVSTGHDTVLAHDGHVSDALIAYHAARARGGVGLIVSQVTGIHETARYTSHVLMGTDDDCIPGFRRLASQVHDHGARIVAQLFHPGREIMETADGTLPVAYAPSAVPSERFHTIPRALPKGMIHEFVQGYAQAARRMEEAGLDGVEIVASHGYLPAQFLNPEVNLREDEYGGDLADRARFLLEVLEAVRDATGAGFVVGLRITGEEHDDTGCEPSEVLEVVTRAAPHLDYVSVAAGTSATIAGSVHIAPPMYFEPGYPKSFSTRVKEAVDLPVILTGRINQPQEAEAALERGEADLCGMTRAMICDPAMPLKTREERLDDIRACIGCNQACIGHFHKGVPISCIQHPETGRELAYAEIPPADTSRRVVVVGGGPAGMKAAAIAASRGHQVTLLERGKQLGGQALLAQLLPGRAEFGGIVTNLAREMENAGVDVHLKTEATHDSLADMAPDAVIIATGGTPRRPVAEISDDVHLLDPWQVLRGEANVGGAVLISDWRGDWTGLGLAEKLAAEGRSVTLAVTGTMAGEALQSYVRDTMLARVARLGVKVVPYARLYGADGDTVYLQHLASEEPMIFEGIDTLVTAHGQAASTALLDTLDGAAFEVTGIGDCMAPRTAEEAVLDGLRAGVAV
ncbi:FAD-dependent oxidoreductase [Roseovarius sp. SCSIO 43702]|uniref:oxidoreductase n=1 Tax=Roseovarius sp. SCSIO 43702 TaxID=2823043 RepID=UPI001C72F8E5|nr:FAD-dependent oxidoreductase [Roseovarius sp. SCSIO 43702]QYX56267.1 FAD-dependent oxidoreductase [Roseovarius sp. SCSIO 43702]